MFERTSVFAPIAVLFALRAASAASSVDVPATPPHRLTLANTVAIAAAQAPTVLEADQRSRAAMARRDQARSVLLPSLSGVASETNRTFNKNTLGFEFPAIPGVPSTPALVGPFDVVDARLRVSQTLFDPAGWERWRAAGVGVEVSHAERGASGESAAQSAALAYLRALRSHAVLEARHSDVALSTELLELAQSQNHAGVAPGIDVTRANTQVSAARFREVQASSEFDHAEIDLARSLGQDPALRFELVDSLSESLGVSDAPAEDAALATFATSRRADLGAALARVRRAQLERTATAAERLPRVDVGADWGASGPHFDEAINTRQLGIAVSVPLMDGLRREGRLAEQAASLEEERERVNDLRDQIGADLGSARIELESARQQIALAVEGVSFAREELSQARERFTNGVAGNTDIITAQSSLLRAREAEIDARFTLAVARVQLARAAGVVQSVR